ncbi:DUF2218 domain-containing protein [Falsiroseomonas sp.]|uniref:DUF2218 domain-containing protein n=1 Tax=Falsiroseomonas sp. TaxID=2870721 RepID=UPI003F6FBA58
MSTASADPTLLRAVAEVPTPQAGRYLQQLCKHFQHKLPATFDATTGHIPFPLGDCRLEARDGVLWMEVTAADAEKLAQLQDVVARHLLRFAFREEMQVAWHPA